MEHKFIIEVRLRHEPPAPEGTPDPKKPQPKVVAVDPQVLNSLLAQLPHALAALQPKPTGQPPKSTGHPPKS